LSAALSIGRKVEHAALRYRLQRRPPPVADPELVDAQLEAFFDELLELTAPGQDPVDVERSVADACARIEEWTA
jgi:hypothetical protein